MKKGLLIIAVAMLAGFTANAQLSIGAGYQGQTRTMQVNSNSPALALDAESDWYNGFYAGFNYNIHLVAGLNIAPGLHFTYNAYRNEENILGVTVKEKEVEMGIKLPVLVNYRFNFRDGKFILAPYAGLTFGFAINDKITVDAGGAETSTDFFDKDNWDGVNAPSRFDMYASVGLMLMFNNHFRVNVGYDLGMLNRMSSLYTETLGVTYDPQMTMGNLNIGIGYEF